ncbi:MAG: sulfite exporter TauE/SafE family protein [Hyphomicrobium sp.]
MDLISTNLHLIVAGGFLIGFLIGITGVGAGSLTTPMLIGIGFHPTVAVGTDLLFASITKASAALRHHRLGNVNWPILGWLAMGSLPGAAIVVGWIYFSGADTHLLAHAIRKVLAVALVCSALAIALMPFLRRVQPSEDAAATDTPPRKLPTFLFGLLLGGMVALTSVGAGAIGVSVLTGLYPMLLARRIVGTDIVHAVPLTLVSGLGHAGMGNLDVTLLGALLAGSVPGILIGSRLTGYIPDWLLRLVLAVTLMYAAYLLMNR